MNKLILSVFMLLAVSKSNGQIPKADTTSWGSIYFTGTTVIKSSDSNYLFNAKQINYDTVSVIFQYSDTSCRGPLCPVLIGKGYATKKYEPYKYYNGVFDEKYKDYISWQTTGYLTQTKQPIPKNWVVWMALETKKDW